MREDDRDVRESSVERRRAIEMSVICFGKLQPAAAMAMTALALAACQPTVKVEAPDKPIVINLNVKIEHDIRVKIDKDVEELLEKNPDIF
jgi:hypothetical protein